MVRRQFFKTDIFLYLLLACQVGLWTQTRDYKPNLAIVPDVPNPLAIKAISLGDEQFYFRTLAFQLQNAGDTFGRFTALKNYNYVKLYHWFLLLDTLDSKSHFVPSLAGYYYSQTQNVPDVKYVIDYLEGHVTRDEYNRYNKWWWLSQAVYLANYRLEDKQLALKLAYELAETPRNDIPLWAKQMPAFIHEQLGEDEQALMIIRHIMDNMDDIAPGELNFMRYFVKDRLNKMIEKYPELKRLMEEQKIPPTTEE